MDRSLGLPTIEALFAMILGQKPDFTSASHPNGGEDRGEAPEEIGKMLALRESLKQQNKRRIISADQQGDNLLYLDILDKMIKVATRHAAPSGVRPDLVRVTSRGRIVQLKRPYKEPYRSRS
jgi:hypothetical protein